MGYSLKPSTMKRISEAQEPTNLSPEDLERNEITVAWILIRQGADYGNPEMMHRGISMLLKLAFQAGWEVEDSILFSERRTAFVKLVEEYGGRNVYSKTQE